MTGHGCFREYLCKYGHDNEEVNCSFCANGSEHAEHVFFYCHRFGLECELLETMIDERVTPDNIVSHMLRSVEVWHYVKMLSAKVMQELRRMERARRTEI